MTSPYPIDTIKRVVAADYHVQPDQFTTRGRAEPLATARIVAMALCRALTGCSNAEIAAAFNRQRTMVGYAVITQANRLATDHHFATRFMALWNACNEALHGKEGA